MSKATTSDDYIYFDEIEDVLASVDLVALLAPLVRESPQYWKWMITGAHSALQGAMVCAFADSSNTSILTNKSAVKMLEWLDADPATRGPYPEEYLAPFGELLDRCITGRPNFEPVVLKPSQLKDIKRLHEHFRNNFAHFTPKGWSIEKMGLPRMVGAALDAVGQLMSRSEVTYRFEESQLERLNDKLHAAKLTLGSERRSSAPR
jgi:hypothetical protein